MTKAGYRKLKAVWLLGSVAMFAAVVASWLGVIPFWTVFVAVIVLGGSAAFAAWVLRDQDFEELPE